MSESHRLIYGTLTLAVIFTIVSLAALAAATFLLREGSPLSAVFVLALIAVFWYEVFRA